SNVNARTLGTVGAATLLVTVVLTLGTVELTYLNEFLAYDGLEIVTHSKGYDVVDRTRGEIVVDVKLEPSHLSHAFIMEQIEKCRTKISLGDHDGSITNARSLVEAVLAAIEKEFDST